MIHDFFAGVLDYDPVEYFLSLGVIVYKGLINASDLELGAGAELGIRPDFRIQCLLQAIDSCIIIISLHVDPREAVFGVSHGLTVVRVRVDDFVKYDLCFVLLAQPDKAYPDVVMGLVFNKKTSENLKTSEALTFKLTLPLPPKRKLLYRQSCQAILIPNPDHDFKLVRIFACINIIRFIRCYSKNAIVVVPPQTPCISAKP